MKEKDEREPLTHVATPVAAAPSSGAALTVKDVVRAGLWYQEKRLRDVSSCGRLSGAAVDVLAGNRQIAGFLEWLETEFTSAAKEEKT